MQPPKDKKKEILIIYHQHTSLEVMYPLAQLFNKQVGVTIPDLPGIGGMDSFYKINEKPDLDIMADYLASIIKLRYRQQRFSVAGISYGFLVVTRMLQRYPDIAAKVDMVLSLTGFSHYEDLNFKKGRRILYKFGANLLSFRLPAALFRNVFLHPFMLNKFYKLKLNGFKSKKRQWLNHHEVKMWRLNDVRTHMIIWLTMLKVNNCEDRINLPVWHVGIKMDTYLNNAVVEQHMRVIFNDFKLKWAPNYKSSLDGSRPKLAHLIPMGLLRQLGSKV